MKYTAVGINHLTWFVEVRIGGEDAMPRLRRIAREKLAGAATEPNRFSWWSVQRFGAYPAVNDRHVVEFFPHLFAGQGGYYGKTLGVDCWSMEKLIAHGDQIYEQMRRDAMSAGPLPHDYFEQISGEHEQVIDIIQSIRSDAGRVYAANLPNRGQAPNLPPEAVVESPAVADASGLRPIAQPPLPAGIAATVSSKLALVETIVDAALEASRDKFIQALLLDGSVRSPETAEQLAAELLAAHAHHLPQFAGAKHE